MCAKVQRVGFTYCDIFHFNYPKSCLLIKLAESVIKAFIFCKPASVNIKYVKVGKMWTESEGADNLNY